MLGVGCCLVQLSLYYEESFVSRLREEVGAEVRAEQVERERRRRQDNSGMRDG